jgi:hypothetical protein
MIVTNALKMLLSGRYYQKLSLQTGVQAFHRLKYVCITSSFKNLVSMGLWWLTPVIIATQEAEIRRIMVQNQSQANSLQNPILKKLITKRAGGVAQVVRMPA